MGDFNLEIEGQPEVGNNIENNNNGNVDGEANPNAPVNEEQDIFQLSKEGEELAMAHASLQETKEALTNSKVTHFGITFSDSANMTRVKNAIIALDVFLNKTIPKEKAAFESELENINDIYLKLIMACENYVKDIVTRKRGKSKSGRNRLELTSQLLEQTKEEQRVFQICANSYFDEPQKYSSDTWTEVLYRVRAKDLSSELNNSDIVSGVTSNVYKRTHNGKTTYIKQEERLSEDGSFKQVFELYKQSGTPKAAETVAIFESIKKGNKINLNDVWNSVKKAVEDQTDKRDTMKPDEYKEYVAKIRKENMDKAISILAGDEAAADYINTNKELVKGFLIYTAKKLYEFHAATKQAGIAPGEVMSNRNVSTSRVAKRLNIEDVVANSRTILMKAEDGSTIKANEMEEAGKLTLDECSMLAKAENKKIMYTPQALRQSWELQVLDLICGQVDRHINNYSANYEIKDDIMYITSIKAFDNDMSFGTMTISQMNNGSKVRALISGRKISIPFLSRGFYEKIMQYSVEQAGLDQLDIRSKEEIIALQSRLTEIQHQLKSYVDRGRITLLDSDEEWKQAVESYYYGVSKKMYSKSYVLIRN